MKDEGMDRRDFLRVAAIAGMGMFLGQGEFASANSVCDLNKGIPVRWLGNTGIELPVLSMRLDRPSNQNLLRRAYDAGIRYFDSAYSYQNGRNEEQLGRFFEGKRRDSFYVSTKGMFPYPLRGDFERVMLEKLDISLKRLKIDFLDIYYTHNIQLPEKITHERILRFLQKIKTEGKARFIGFSTDGQDPEIINAAVDSGIYDVGLINYNCRMKELKANEEAIERAVRAGMGIISMHSTEGESRSNDLAGLKWIWQNKNITTVIQGVTNYNDLEECLAITS